MGGCYVKVAAESVHCGARGGPAESREARRIVRFCRQPNVMHIVRVTAGARVTDRAARDSV